MLSGASSSSSSFFFLPLALTNNLMQERGNYVKEFKCQQSTTKLSVPQVMCHTLEFKLFKTRKFWQLGH